MLVLRDLAKIKIGVILKGHKDHHANSKFVKSFAIISAILIAVLFLLILFTIAGACCMTNHSDVLPALNLIILMIVCFTFSYFKVNQILFCGSDNELLMALPIPLKYVLYSRMLFLLCITCIISIFISIPISFTYYIYHGFKPIPFILWIIVAAAYSALIIMISSCLNMLASIVTNCLKNAKWIRIALQLTIFLGGAIFVYWLLKVDLNSISFGHSDLELVGNILNGSMLRYRKLSIIAKLFEGIIILGRYYYVPVLLSLFFVLSMIYIAAAAQFFLPLQEGFMQQACEKKNGTYKIKKRHTLHSLIYKELRRIFRSEICIINVMVPLIFLFIVSVVFFYISPGEILASFKVEHLFYDSYFSKDSLAVSLTFAIMTLLGASNYSAVSVSLEGESIWIPLSMPISMKEIVLSKTIAQIILSMPFAVFSFILLIKQVEASFFVKLFLVLLPVIYVIFAAMFGLFINLHHIQLDWGSEVEVVKFSMSSLVGILGSAFLPILLSLLFQRINIINYGVLEFILFVLLVLGSLVLYNLAVRRGLLEHLNIQEIKRGNSDE